MRERAEKLTMDVVPEDDIVPANREKGVPWKERTGRK